MSRMMAIVADPPITVEHAVGKAALDAFAAQARLHTDGWGVARLSAAGDVDVVTSVEPLGSAETLHQATARPAAGWLLYLRFASRSAKPTPVDAQPFAARGLAFQHNGALAPRHAADSMLTDAERAALRGATDSERYFALARRNADAGLAESMGGAARALRSAYPTACLNAFALTAHVLVVVQSSGGSSAPLAAFAARGALPPDLPPAHDADYNRLVMAEPRPGVRVAATPGLPGEGWSRLPEDSVTRVEAAGATTTLL